MGLPPFRVEIAGGTVPENLHETGLFFPSSTGNSGIPAGPMESLK
jgi:hypothetical protein